MFYHTAIQHDVYGYVYRLNNIYTTDQGYTLSFSALVRTYNSASGKYPYANSRIDFAVGKYENNYFMYEQSVNYDFI